MKTHGNENLCGQTLFTAIVLSITTERRFRRHKYRFLNQDNSSERMVFQSMSTLHMSRCNILQTETRHETLDTETEIEEAQRILSDWFGVVLPVMLLNRRSWSHPDEVITAITKRKPFPNTNVREVVATPSFITGVTSGACAACARSCLCLCQAR